MPYNGSRLCVSAVIELLMLKFKTKVKMKNESSTTVQKQALRKTDVRRSAYKCGSCSIGVVEVIQKDTKQHSTIDVKKCTNCKHQYGIKGVMSLEHYA